MKLRAFTAICIIATLFSLILGLFWYQEGQYLLPTPVPASYQVVLAGQWVDVQDAGDIKGEEVNKKPVMLHFFNPDCPCSRFNIDHFRTLVQKYKDQVTFCAVLQVEQPEGAIERFHEQYDLPVAVVVDHGKRLARACGVYSTPQAVLLDSTHTLYYRGNYNRTRYCTDPRSNFAQMALDSLLAHRPVPVFIEPAIRAYGCELPDNRLSNSLTNRF